MSAMPKQEWFIPGTGIRREIITAKVPVLLGSNATVRPGSGPYQGRTVEGYVLKAHRNLTSEQINDLKQETLRVEREEAKAKAERQRPGTLEASTSNPRRDGVPRHDVGRASPYEAGAHVQVIDRNPEDEDDMDIDPAGSTQHARPWNPHLPETTQDRRADVYNDHGQAHARQHGSGPSRGRYDDDQYGRSVPRSRFDVPDRSAPRPTRPRYQDDADEQVRARNMDPREQDLRTRRPGYSDYDEMDQDYRPQDRARRDDRPWTERDRERGPPGRQADREEQSSRTIASRTGRPDGSYETGRPYADRSADWTGRRRPDDPAAVRYHDRYDSYGREIPRRHQYRDEPPPPSSRWDDRGYDREEDRHRDQNLDPRYGPPSAGPAVSGAPYPLDGHQRYALPPSLPLSGGASVPHPAAAAAAQLHIDQGYAPAAHRGYQDYHDYLRQQAQQQYVSIMPRPDSAIAPGFVPGVYAQDRQALLAAGQLASMQQHQQGHAQYPPQQQAWPPPSLLPAQQLQPQHQWGVGPGSVLLPGQLPPQFLPAGMPMPPGYAAPPLQGQQQVFDQYGRGANTRVVDSVKKADWSPAFNTIPVQQSREQSQPTSTHSNQSVTASSATHPSPMNQAAELDASEEGAGGPAAKRKRHDRREGPRR